MLQKSHVVILIAKQKKKFYVKLADMVMEKRKVSKFQVYPSIVLNISHERGGGMVRKTYAIFKMFVKNL